MGEWSRFAPFTGEIVFRATLADDIDMQAVAPWMLSHRLNFGMCEVHMTVIPDDRVIEIAVVAPIDDVTYPPGPNYTPPPK